MKLPESTSLRNKQNLRQNETQSGAVSNSGRERQCSHIDGRRLRRMKRGGCTSAKLKCGPCSPCRWSWKPSKSFRASRRLGEGGVTRGGGSYGADGGVL